MGYFRNRNIIKALIRSMTLSRTTNKNRKGFLNGIKCFYNKKI
jgi:hypothetical protein